jgi:hypothetical protein
VKDQRRRCSIPVQGNKTNILCLRALRKLELAKRHIEMVTCSGSNIDSETMNPDSLCGFPQFFQINEGIVY